MYPSTRRCGQIHAKERSVQIMNKEALKAVVNRIEGYRDEVIALETELTRRQALGPESDGQGEKEKSAFLKSYLEGMGLRVDQYDAPDDRVPCGYRPNLVSILEGEVSSPRLMVMAHTDVVPPGDLGLWTGDPWTVRTEGDKLIGRGVEDNQAGLVAGVLAAKAFKEAGVTPRLPLGLVLVADEETGSKYGLKYLLENHRELFDKQDLIIIPDAGNPKGTNVEVAEKSILWMKFRTLGKQTHGSTPEKGKNAHKAAAYLITRLDTLYRQFKKKNPLFGPPISTFEPTKKLANVPNINTIPGEDIFFFDCRVLPEYKLADVLKVVKQLVAETQKKFGVKIQVEFPQKESAAPPTDPKAPVARAIARAMSELRRRRTNAVGIGGGTVAKYFRDGGFPCVVWATLDERAHTADEYVYIPYILEDAKVLAHIALQDA